MNQCRYYAIVLLLCSCGAVNILFYALTNETTNKYDENILGRILKPGHSKPARVPIPGRDAFQRSKPGRISSPGGDAFQRSKPARISSPGGDAFQRSKPARISSPGGGDFNRFNGIPSVIRKLNNAGPTEDIHSFQMTDSKDDVDSPRIFEFLINNIDICGYNKTNSIVIVVISKFNNFLRRNAIRNTWGSVVKDLNGTILFLLGKSSDISNQAQVVKESELYADVVQVNIMDTYENLTLKSIAMLQWLTDYCTNSQFYLKVDDDVYVNVENVLQTSRTRKENELFLCHVFKRAPPIRDPHSKWFVSHEHYSKDFFPTYCSGTAYVFSSDVISKLYLSTLKTKLCIMEDVFITGLAAEGKGITHVHNGGFAFYKRPATGCEYVHALTGHEVTIGQMYVIFAQLTNHEIDCQTKENLILIRAEKENKVL